MVQHSLPYKRSVLFSLFLQKFYCLLILWLRLNFRISCKFSARSYKFLYLIFLVLYQNEVLHFYWIGIKTILTTNHDIYVSTDWLGMVIEKLESLPTYRNNYTMYTQVKMKKIPIFTLLFNEATVTYSMSIFFFSELMIYIITGLIVSKLTHKANCLKPVEAKNWAHISNWHGGLWSQTAQECSVKLRVAQPLWACMWFPRLVDVLQILGR